MNIRNISWGILAATLATSVASAEVKPVGTVLSEFCGKATTLGERADKACITAAQPIPGPAPVTVRYVTLEKKDRTAYLRLAAEKIRIARPAGCAGYTLSGVTFDERDYAIQTEGTAVLCEGAKSTLAIDLLQGKSALKEIVDVERMAHTK